jgi:hypothetical protein
MSASNTRSFFRSKSDHDRPCADRATSRLAPVEHYHIWPSTSLNQEGDEPGRQARAFRPVNFHLYREMISVRVTDIPVKRKSRSGADNPT